MSAQAENSPTAAVREQDVQRLFAQALDTFDRAVAAVGDDQWSAPTPCTDWDVRALVGHLVTEQLWVSPMLSGETMEEVGDRFDGDSPAHIVGADPRAAWRAASNASRALATAPGALDATVHASYGDVPALRYLAEMTMDATVHAWDLARAVGADERLPQELVQLGLSMVEANRDLLAASGLFAEPVPVPAGSEPQVRLLALLGRRA